MDYVNTYSIFKYTCDKDQGIGTRALTQYNITAGTDPEILHGRWLMGWLPIVNYTGARGDG